MISRLILFREALTGRSLKRKFLHCKLKHVGTYFVDDEIAVGRRASAGRSDTDADDSFGSLLSMANRSSALSIFRDRSFFLVTFFGFLNCS